MYMKAKKWFGIMFAFILILSGCTNNRGVVENPAFVARNADGLEIAKVELSDTATVLYIKAFYPPGSWIKRIDTNSFLADNKGKRYTILSTEGIGFDDELYMPESGEAEFSLIFPPVASNATFIDFSEGDNNSSLKIYGIQLTNKPIKVNLPKGFKEVTIDKNAILPPIEFKTGKARIEGQILNFHKGMQEEVLIYVASPVEYPSVEITLTVNANGKFSGEIDAFSTHPAAVLWENSLSQFFIAPNETTSIILNPAENSRRMSRFAGNRPSLGEPVYYGGYLASLSTEFNQINPNLYVGNIYESYLSFLQSIETKTPEELKTFFLDDYKEKKVTLDIIDASPACKQIMNYIMDFRFASYIIDIPSLLDYAHTVSNQIQDDNKYYATRKFNLPDDFYDVLKEFSLINDPQMLYAKEATQYAYQWQRQDKQPVFSKALDTDSGILFDLMNVAEVSNNIKEFKPVSEAQIEEIPVAYQEFIRNKNSELLQLIEEIKNKTELTENDIKIFADEDVIPFILSKFRGKPVLLDFWETWCGPCLRANEDMKPLKAELADKDIVYVFVASESSPLETWQNMILDLPGEHFRLTEKQNSYLRKTFNIEGVPTYFFIDREGNIKDKHTGYPGSQNMKDKLLQLLD